MNKILITGHGRSATGYTTRLLQAVGVDIGHEIIGNDGMVSWPHIAYGELSWIGHIDSIGFNHIIQQIRHPLDTISSAQTMRDEAFEYMFRHIGHPGGQRGLRWYMWTWLYWNEYIEQFAKWQFRIEDIVSVWPQLCWEFGLSTDIPIPEVSQNTNTRQHGQYVWGDLKAEDEELFRAILAKAHQYGYQVEMPTVSVCMMGLQDGDVKFLPQCLESIKHFADQIIFINTKSNQEQEFPQALLKQYGAEIYEHPWEKNFALHRNQSLSYARSDWILFIDCDEELFGDPETFKLFLAEMPEQIVCAKISMSDIQGDAEVMRFNTAKCFRRGYIHYQSIVHNQPVIHGLAVNCPEIYMHHYGYDLTPEGKQEKDRRTSELLYKRLEDNSEDYQTHFYLAQSAGQNGNAETCLYHCLKYIENRDYVTGWNNSIWATATQAAVNCGKWEKAEELLFQGLVEIPKDLDLNWIAAKLAVQIGDVDMLMKYGQQYLETFNAFQQDSSVQQERFTYTQRPEDLSAVLFHLGYVYAQKARNFFLKLYETTDSAENLVQKAKQEIGVYFDAV